MPKSSREASASSRSLRRVEHFLAFPGSGRSAPWSKRFVRYEAKTLRVSKPEVVLVPRPREERVHGFERNLVGK